MLAAYSELSTSTVMQRQSVAYKGSTALLEFHLSQLAGEVETINIDDKKFLRVFKDITVKIDSKMVVLEVRFDPPGKTPQFYLLPRLKLILSSIVTYI